MAVKSVGYSANGPANTTSNTERGPSEVIWDYPGTPNAWVEDFIQDPRLGMYFFDDFEVAPSIASTAAAAVTGGFGRWSIYAGKTGAVGDAKIVGGGVSFTPGTSASNEPMTIMSQTGCFQITSGSSSGLQGKLAFECRVLLQSVTASMRDAFVGLCDPQGAPNIAIPLTAGTGTNQLCTSNNLIGFYNAYSGGAQDWGFVYQLASTAPVFATNLQSLVSQVTGSAIAANTWYKLGFTFDPVALTQQISSASTGQTAGTTARAMIKVYVNGIQAVAFLTQAANIFTASFPTGIMGPVAAICNDVSSVGASTNAGALSVDWIRVAQSAQT